MEPELQGLPIEILLDLLLLLTISEIGRLCQTSSFFATLCTDEFFWKARVTYDRPELRRAEPVSSWRELYQRSLYAWGAGDFGLNDYLYRTRPTIFDGSIAFKQLAIGAEYALGLSLDDIVWIFGNNFYRQLGTNDRRSRNRFIETPYRAKSIYAGNRQTIFIDFEDYVWVAGVNNAGQLGIGYKNPVMQFSRLDFKAKRVSLGTQHTFFIDLDSNVWASGSNSYGQLGLGHRNQTNRPVQIPGIKAKEVTAGETFSALIDDQDRVWVFGWNKRGQLSLPLTRYPGLAPEDRIELSPVQIPGVHAKRVAAGGDFLLVVDLEDRLWSCGWNYTGQLGLGHERTVYQLELVSQDLRVKNLAVGLSHSLVLDLEDHVWSFGANCFGQLGLGHTNYQNRPAQIRGIKAKLVRAGPAMSGMIVLASRED